MAKRSPSPDVTVAEAAQLLGVSDARIRQLILQGRLSARRIGARLLLISRADLAKLKRRKYTRPDKPDKFDA